MRFVHENGGLCFFPPRESNFGESPEAERGHVCSFAAQRDRADLRTPWGLKVRVAGRERAVTLAASHCERVGLSACCPLRNDVVVAPIVARAPFVGVLKGGI